VFILVVKRNSIGSPAVKGDDFKGSQDHVISKIPAKKWGDTEIAERGRSVLVMRARYRSAGLTPHQRGWTDSG